MKKKCKKKSRKQASRSRRPQKSSSELPIPEKELIETVTKIVKSLYLRYKFSYFSVEDFIQEMIANIIEKGVLDKWDKKRPVGRLLYSHINFRLQNFKRDNYQRLEPPCTKCPLNAYIDKKCAIYDNLEECSFYSSFLARNEAKKSLAQPAPQTKVVVDKSDSLCPDSMENKEFINWIRATLPDEHIESLRDFLDGKKLPAEQEQALFDIVREMWDG